MTTIADLQRTGNRRFSKLCIINLIMYIITVACFIIVLLKEFHHGAYLLIGDKSTLYSYRLRITGREEQHITLT